MGTWNTAIFSSDTASDIREEFITHIGDGKTSEEAAAALLQAWRSSLNDPDEKTTFWLALALTQWNLGRLLPHVRDEALRIIDSGEDLKRWEDDKNLHSKRKKMLERLHAQLLSEQPPAKKVPKKFRNSDNWPSGSIHAYRLNNGELCLFRVIGHHIDKGGTSSIVELLDWIGAEIPDQETASQLKVRYYPYPNGRKLGQFMLAATSERERKAARIADTGLTSNAEQKPGGYSVFLYRHLDRHLTKFFNLGHS